MSDDRAMASALLGRPVDALLAVSGGGNNRVFRVLSGGASFAMKRYDSQDASGRERFERETAASRFLAGTALADRVPHLVAADRTRTAALFDWIDGSPPEDRGPEALAQMLAFVAALRDASTGPTAQDLGEAAEACLSPAELARQIDRRRVRFGEIADEPQLAAYLGRFDRVWQALRDDLADRAEALVPEHRTLSPSDFGLHNALRRPDGQLVFLDFEYFGWDDPVKLTADMLWHPGMMLNDDETAAVRDALATMFGRHDAGFAHRLARVLPAFGLRWCLILLNEFLPDRWARRRQARALDPADWAAAKRRQLAKAEHLIARVETCRAEHLQ